MKKILLSLSLFAAVTASAQTYMSIGAGYSTTKTAPVAELNVGHNVKGLLFQAGYIAHLNRRDAAIFNLRTGSELLLNEDASIYLTGGAALHLVSTDHKERNMMSYIVGAEYVRFNCFGAITFSVQHTAGHLFGVAGVRYYFNR